MTAGFLAGYGPLSLSSSGRAIGSRDTSFNLSPLHGGYSTAPRGAEVVLSGELPRPASARAAECRMLIVCWSTDIVAARLVAEPGFFGVPGFLIG